MPRNDPQGGILNFGAHGAYKLFAPFALVATQAGPSEVFSFRWAPATAGLICVVERIEITLQQGVVASAYTQSDLRLFKCTGYTVADSAGTALTFPSAKRTAGMVASQVNDIRVTAAAVGLTVGTRTLDNNPLMGFAFALPTLASGSPYLYSDVVDLHDGLSHPLVLGANEGLILRTTVAFPATGTASCGIEMDWTEVDSFGP